MTPSELVARVTRETCVVTAVLVGPAALLGGPAGALGVLAGGTLTVLSFRWLAARAAAAVGGHARGGWLAAAGLRFGASMAACGALLATGWAHPLALLAGVTVLPCAVVRLGLTASGEEG
jgi:hypothetical protein